MLTKIRLALLIMLFTAISLEAATIRGKISIDESWEPMIFLSLINSFDDLNTASYDFLVYEAVIDSSGFFEMSKMIIPEGDRVYRLHIVKKGDPVSTIIIGGQDENFIHFTMNENSQIEVLSNENRAGFQNCLIEGGGANKELHYLFGLQKELQTPPTLPSKQNRDILKHQIFKKYRDLADTSSFSIIKLMAIHLFLERTDAPDIELMEKTKSQVSDTSSPYYRAFVDQLDYLKYQSQKSEFSNPAWIKWIGLIALIVFLALGYWMRVRKFVRTKSKPNKDLVSTLSIQEKKVFDLLKTGASNKEISTELNIEVSTVKSHVHKVYSRLGVKSRKEIVNREW